MSLGLGSAQSSSQSSGPQSDDNFEGLEMPITPLRNQAKSAEAKLNQAIKPNPWREPKKLVDEKGEPRPPILLKFSKKTTSEKEKADTPIQKRTRAGKAKK